MAKSTESNEASLGINSNRRLRVEEENERGEQRTLNNTGLALVDTTPSRNRSRAPIIQDGNNNRSAPRPTPRHATSHLSVEARFGRAALLKNVVDSAALRFSEAELSFTNGGLQMTAMDGPRVAFVEFVLKRRDFEFYECTDDEQLFVSLKNLQKAMNCATKEDDLKLEFNHGDDIVKMTINDDIGGKVEEIRFRLWERFDTYCSPADAKAAYLFTCTMPSQKFLDVCNHLEAFGDEVAIKAKNGTIAFCADGEIGSNTTIKFRPNYSEEVNVAMRPGCDLVKFFSTCALKQIAKAVNVSKEVEISGSREYPIKIRYPIGENSFLAFYLSARADGDQPEPLQTQQPF